MQLHTEVQDGQIIVTATAHHIASLKNPSSLHDPLLLTDRSNEPISKEEFFRDSLGCRKRQGARARVDCVTSALVGAGDVIGLNRREAGHSPGKCPSERN